MQALDVLLRLDGREVHLRDPHTFEEGRELGGRAAVAGGSKDLAEEAAVVDEPGQGRVRTPSIGEDRPYSLAGERNSGTMSSGVMGRRAF